MGSVDRDAPIADGRQQLADERWAAHRREHESEERARITALDGLDKRLDSMNEFRDQLREQAQMFARAESVAALDAQIERRYEELRSMVATEREERREQQNIRSGTFRGLSQTAAIGLGIVALVATLVGIVASVALIAGSLSP